MGVGRGWMRSFIVRLLCVSVVQFRIRLRSEVFLFFNISVRLGMLFVIWMDMFVWCSLVMTCVGFSCLVICIMGTPSELVSVRWTAIALWKWWLKPLGR